MDLPRRCVLLACWIGSGIGCQEPDPIDDPFPDTFEAPRPGSVGAIAEAQGLTRYLGTARPAETMASGGFTTYAFDPADGPMCMRGATYHTSIQDRGSEDLLIFLQGGGACWSAFCLAVTAAAVRIPSSGLLRSDPANPLSDWNILYLPYCDGSLFAGDRDVDEDGDGVPDRFHHGLANLSAALTMGFQHYPTPRRVVLAGSSGGGFGTILASFLVRYLYPDVPLLVLNDAGIGVARGDDPAFVATLIDDFGARDFIPDDCVGCTEDGHITDLVDYLLDRDDGVRIGAISSLQDAVISEVFLMTTRETWSGWLLDETDALHAEHPDAYRRFFFGGWAHTALLGDVTGIIGSDLGAVELPEDSGVLGVVELADMDVVSVEDVVLRDWIAAMLAEDDAGWSDLVAAPPAP
ncbi:MAG: vtpJ-therm [Sandaracinaceae bacterium]|nr:vtpJ-therm [Sandaracinaceae bacterium]